MTSPIEMYCQCMEEVKIRLTLANSVITRKLTLNREDFDTEAVCLQIRKALELIAFSSLCAHEKSYSEMHKDTVNLWSAKRLLARLNKIHPNFYPIPVEVTVGKKERIKKAQPLEDGFLDYEEFVFLYDKCSEVLHSWNPYRPGDRIVNFDRGLDDWMNRIRTLLKFHTIRLIGSPDIWVVQMHNTLGHRLIMSQPDAD